MLLCVALCLTLLGRASALFEDQAGKIDWSRQNIGRVTQALFHSSGSQRLALLSTEQGVVAGVDLRTGETAWRQVLPDGEDLAELVQLPKSVVSIGTAPRGNGRVGVVRMWTAAGSMKWDALIDSEERGATCTPSVSVTDAAVVAACADVVVALSPDRGDPLWFFNGESSLVIKEVLALGDSVHVYGLATAASGKTTLRVVTLRATSGEQLHSAEVSLPVVPSGETVVTLDGSTFALLSDNGESIMLHEVGSKGGVKQVKLSSVLPAGLPLDEASLLRLSLPKTLVLRLAHDSSAILKVEGGSLVVSRIVSDSAHVLAHATARDGKALLALAAEDASGISLEVLALEADGGLVTLVARELLSESSSAERGVLSAAWLNSYTRKDGSSGYRLLISTQDAALQLLQATREGGRASWVREEALGSISGAELVSLPMAAIELDAKTPFFGFALPRLLSQISSPSSPEATAPDPAATEKPPVYGDAYGTHKALILRTAASKVFGLHSSSGDIMWSRFIAPLSPSQPPPQLLATFLSGAGSALQASLLAQDETSWRLVDLNPVTGKLLGVSSRQGRVLHAAKLPFSTAEADGVLLIVDEDLKVQLHPETAASRALLAEHAPSLYFYVIGRTEVAGYGLTPSAGGVAVELRWSVQLPASAEVESTTFPHGAAIGSPVRIKGDKNVLHKYINRNLLALSMVVEEEDAPSVQVLLLDTVSGRMLHSAVHPDTRGPVRMLLGDHWLLYTYWSPSAHQHLLSVSELYRNTSFSDDVVSLVMAGPVDYTRQENKFDAFTAPAPHVMTQSYAFATSIAAMGVSLTRAGITPKQVLLATSAGELLALDKRLFDPRRPLVHPSKLSTADKEEGLVPYSPSLGAINPLSTISHRHQIARPRQIVTAPTMLESTSLVFTYGLDLFLTRVAPAKEFDRLNEDFNYVALVGAIAFLLVATLASNWYSGRADLIKAWS